VNSTAPVLPQSIVNFDPACGANISIVNASIILLTGKRRPSVCVLSPSFHSTFQRSNVSTFQPSNLLTFQRSNLPTFQPSNLPTPPPAIPSCNGIPSHWSSQTQAVHTGPQRGSTPQHAKSLACLILLLRHTGRRSSRCQCPHLDTQAAERCRPI